MVVGGACAAEGDAGSTGRRDGARPDAHRDAAFSDTGHAMRDAGTQDVDAAPGSDAAWDAPADAAWDAPADSADPWTGTPCSVAGASGTCMDAARCVGEAVPGFCPGPSAIQCCLPPMDGGVPSACDPGAAPQPNVGLVEEAGIGGCPAGMTPVADFCIDRFEASLLEVRVDGTTTPWSPFLNPGARRVRAVSLRGGVPQGYISDDQAAAACAEAGKRLCTDAEWLRACRGAAGHTYPYGDRRMPGLCNDARAVHPAVEYFGTSADWIWSMLGHRCINQLPDSLTPTGSHAACVTEDGAFDMMGNLHEWTADPTGTFRGGFYVDTVVNGDGCLYRTTAHDRAHWDYSTGFRCCAD